MTWKKGKVTFDDGSKYEADLLIKNGEVWNMKVHKDGKIVEEIDVNSFSQKLGKTPQSVYPFTYQIEE